LQSSLDSSVAGFVVDVGYYSVEDALLLLVLLLLLLLGTVEATAARNEIARAIIT